MNDVGIETNWEIIKGDQKFFTFTKKLHNLLHMPGRGKIESEEIVY